jgi:hypothetical protein
MIIHGSSFQSWGHYNMGYNPTMLQEIELGMLVRLRKPHPCGGYEWKIVRLGADIGLECLTCSHRVLLSRRELSHRLKKILPSVEAGSSESSQK